MKLLRHIVTAYLIASAGLAAAQAPTLQAPITVHGAGPFHRLTLPNAIYGRAAFDDLRDLRVRNANGQAVPFAWLEDGLDAPAPRIASLHAPLFAVPAAAADGATAGSDAPLLGFKLRTDGSLALAALPAVRPRSSAVTTWVIDASKVDGALVQARFEIAPEALGLFAFTLEGSDDLRLWHRIGGDEQLVRLRHADQTIERLALEIDHARARFLRLRWQDPASTPALTGVWLDSVPETEPASPLEWTPEQRPSSCGTDYCDYAAPRGLPLQSLRIALADANTLAPLRIVSLASSPSSVRKPARNALYVLRHGGAQAPSATTPELLLADTVVYRLQQASGEARSGAVALDGSPHVTLRLRTHGSIRALGSTPPLLSFGTRPRTLVFLAQGQPPFALTWNAASQPTSPDAAPALPLATLVPGHRAGQALTSDAATLDLAPLATSPAPPGDPGVPTRKLWLWVALAGGLLLLAAMAGSLLRGLKTDAADSAR
jgi:hypothetical protein